MVIIVEGPDGSGKSTLIQNLLTSYKSALLYHFGAPIHGEDQFGRYAKPLIEMPATQLLIYDRSWYSEFVYGPIMREDSELTSEHLVALEALVLRNGGGHVIYCTGKPSTLWARCKLRGESYIPDAKAHAEICQKYDEIMTNVCHLPIVTLDVTSHHCIDICKM